MTCGPRTRTRTCKLVIGDTDFCVDIVVRPRLFIAGDVNCEGDYYILLRYKYTTVVLIQTKRIFKSVMTSFDEKSLIWMKVKKLVQIFQNYWTLSFNLCNLPTCVFNEIYWKIIRECKPPPSLALASL